MEGEIVAEPSDVLWLARAIEQWGALDRRAAVRERLREKGAEFSMERNVRETLAILEKLRPPVVEEMTKSE